VKQEYFDESFSTIDLNKRDWQNQVEAALVSMRRVAAEIAKDWLLNNGYFNGEITTEVFVYSEIQQCNVQVVLTDFGLPSRSVAEKEEE
jgi:hypothetical protein